MTEYHVPSKLLPKYEEITAIAEQFCHEHLNDEYASLVKKMTAALARKRPSPLESGRAKSWAGGIVYALGRVNFLFDRSQTPYMSSQELCKRLGVSQGTASAKATDIFRRLDLMQFHPDYTVASLMDDNPLVWFLLVDGVIMDIRTAPRALQEMAYEKGLIPYIPADRDNTTDDA